MWYNKVNYFLLIGKEFIYGWENLNQENIDEGITQSNYLILKTKFSFNARIGILVVLLGIIYTRFIVTPMYTSSVDIHIKIENIDENTNPSVNVSIVNQVKQNIKEIANIQK